MTSAPVLKQAPSMYSSFKPRVAMRTTVGRHYNLRYIPSLVRDVVVLFFWFTHYAFGCVADLLVPSSSLLPNRCSRGTASTPWCFPSASSGGTYKEASYAAGSAGLGPPPASLLNSFCRGFLGPLVFFSVFVFWFGLSPFSRRLSLWLLLAVLSRFFLAPSTLRPLGTLFRWIPGFTGFSRGFTRCGGNVAQILHAELSSHVLNGASVSPCELRGQPHHEFPLPCPLGGYRPLLE